MPVATGPQQNPRSGQTLAKPVGSAFAMFLLRCVGRDGSVHVLPPTHWALGVSCTGVCHVYAPATRAPAANQKGGPKAHHPASKEGLYFHIKQNFCCLSTPHPHTGGRPELWEGPGPPASPMLLVPRPCHLLKGGPGEKGPVLGGNARESWAEAGRGA